MSEPEIQFKTYEESEGQKPIFIFGKDIRKIKCFRNSFLYGLYLGIAGGLASFLFTSKISFSTHVAFASIWIGVFGYWIPCRYKFETELLKYEAVRKKAIQNLSERKNSSDKKLS